MFDHMSAGKTSLGSIILEAAMQFDNASAIDRILHAITINQVDLARDELNRALSPNGEKIVCLDFITTAFDTTRSYCRSRTVP